MNTRPQRRLSASLLAAVVSLCLLGLSACSSSAPTAADSGNTTATGGGTASQSSASTPYDITPLLDPSHKYLGAALPNIGKSMSAYTSFSSEIGKQPNLLEYYASWGDGFDASAVRNIDNAGALAYMAWEPFKPSIASIAAGSTDAYIKTFAEAVRKLNLPLAISFGHEMNGDWYPWGTQGTTAADFVHAWQHIHDIFNEVGATNVIWIWSPNVINPVPSVQLKAYYPGDAYVDWIGMIGYYTLTGEDTFKELYGPTMTEVGKFTSKPYIISETASQAGQRRKADVDNLFDGVATHDNVLGFVWFDMIKRADWRIEISPVALAEFKARASSSLFGFDVRNP